MAKTQKQRRWAKGELEKAVVKALGKRPQTINQLANKVGSNYFSVLAVLNRGIGKVTGSVRENAKGKPSAQFVRA